MSYLLVQPTVLYKYSIDGLRVANYVSLTVYGDDTGLVAKECPGSDELTGMKYVFYGGHEYITTDTALRDLWLAAGWTVTNV